VWALIAAIDLGLLIAILSLVRNGFAFHIRFGASGVDVSKPIFVLALWLTAALPVTVVIRLLAHLIRRKRQFTGRSGFR
jgi:hypothetical protein